MTVNQFDIATILNLLTAIAALSAVILAILSENRAQKRYKQDIERQEKLAAASVRPALTIDKDRIFTTTQIFLRNQGLGTAKSIDFTFTKNGRQSKCRIIDVFDPTYADPFDSVMSFYDKEQNHLRPGGEYVLFKITRENLEKQGITPEGIGRIFAELDKQIQGLTIVVNYEDVLGNQQKEFRITLTSVDV